MPASSAPAAAAGATETAVTATSTSISTSAAGPVTRGFVLPKKHEGDLLQPPSSTAPAVTLPVHKSKVRREQTVALPGSDTDHDGDTENRGERRVDYRAKRGTPPHRSSAPPVAYRPRIDPVVELSAIDEEEEMDDTMSTSSSINNALMAAMTASAAAATMLPDAPASTRSRIGKALAIGVGALVLGAAVYYLYKYVQNKKKEMEELQCELDVAALTNEQVAAIARDQLEHLLNQPLPAPEAPASASVSEQPVPVVQQQVQQPSILTTVQHLPTVVEEVEESSASEPSAPPAADVLLPVPAPVAAATQSALPEAPSTPTATGTSTGTSSSSISSGVIDLTPRPTDLLHAVSP